MVMGYMLDGWGLIFVRGKGFFSSQHPAHSSSYPMGTVGTFPGHEAEHSSPPSAEVTNSGAIPPLPHMPSWHSD
jgi:hypothetical protein